MQQQSLAGAYRFGHEVMLVLVMDIGSICYYDILPRKERANAQDLSPPDFNFFKVLKMWLNGVSYR